MITRERQTEGEITSACVGIWQEDNHRHDQEQKGNVKQSSQSVHQTSARTGLQLISLLYLKSNNTKKIKCRQWMQFTSIQSSYHFSQARKKTSPTCQVVILSHMRDSASHTTPPIFSFHPNRTTQTMRDLFSSSAHSGNNNKNIKKTERKTWSPR